MRDKKSYTCEILGRTLHFQPKCVTFCCSNTEGLGVDYKPGEVFNIDKIFKTENEYIKDLKYGKIPAKCEGCIEYKEKNYKNIFDFLFSKSNKCIVKEIIVNHFQECDCDCIYCTQKYIHPKKEKKNYDLLPIIKELYKNNAIDKNNLRVDFQGGNISELDEFEALIREFLANGCKNIDIKTNGIKYLPIIEEISEQALILLEISLDCGTKETFKKIKHVDGFDSVINNIKNFSIKTTALISLKYIIIKDVNDNFYELQKFLEIVRELRCVTNVYFEIDFRDILINKKKTFKIPEHYYDLINEAKNFCSENRIGFIVNPYTKQYMEKNKNVQI